MKKIIIIICSIALIVSCALDEPERQEVAFIQFNYSDSGPFTLPQFIPDIVRFFCSDPNVPAVLQKSVSWETVPGQYYLEYTIDFNNITWYIIYEIVLYKNVTMTSGHDPSWASSRTFSLSLWDDGPDFWQPSEHDHKPKPETGTLPLSMVQRYIGENRGPILNSSTQKLEGGHMSMWYGKLED